MLCRRGMRDSFCQASLCTAYYQGAQCSRLCRARAEPVCRIKWIRRHDTFPSCRLRRSLHSRSATWQAKPLATSGSVSTRQRQDMMNKGLREQARESKEEISFACEAIMYEQYVILYYIVGPTCWGPNSCVRAPLRDKREAFGVHKRDLQTDTSSRELPHSRGKAIQHTVDVVYYAPAARTTLNLAVFIVFLSGDRTRTS